MAFHISEERYGRLLEDMKEVVREQIMDNFYLCNTSFLIYKFFFIAIPKTQNSAEFPKHRNRAISAQYFFHAISVYIYSAAIPNSPKTP